MGVGIVLSVRSQLRSGRHRSQIVGKAVSRMLKLVVLGILDSNLNHNNYNELRFPGVLQRLGVSYFLVTFLEATLMKRQPNFQYGRWVVIQDILDSWAQWVVVILLTLLHTAITLHLPVPGCPTGYLGPGGLHDHSTHFNCTGGAQAILTGLCLA
ncbi:heparan-alpha-glucosaminide N-acetyltransferase-like [Nilaparvata lugens]|uniref:heparan-alpha-glucosaminide N-acetyltransferase-like n=1 Tax=Nilaparvata lugens TaxID=108931 RepID=UPI00193CD979|nr:heparan-alpha-glucosaminide N-acetyltransferase-like [Nilaparvata lugens]